MAQDKESYLKKFTHFFYYIVLKIPLGREKMPFYEDRGENEVNRRGVGTFFSRFIGREVASIGAVDDNL